MPRGLTVLSLAGLLLPAAPAAWSQAAGPPADVVAQCIASDTTDTGLLELETQCPGIEHALVELGYSPFLSEQQLEELSVFSLQDLRRLTNRYARPPAAPGGIATDSLGPVLESLEEQRRVERPLTLLERVKRWLRELFERRQNQSPSWLDRWLEEFEVPTTVTRIIVYGLVILVIALAIAVLINELRAAGVLRRRGAKNKGAAAVADVSRTSAELTLADLESAPPAERPSALLRILVSALVKRGRLRADRSLTHRELTARVALDDDAQRECFKHVTRLSERTVYGNARVPLDEIDRVVQAGRELLAQIAASTAAASGLAATQDAASRGAGK